MLIKWVKNIIFVHTCIFFNFIFSYISDKIQYILLINRTFVRRELPLKRIILVRIHRCLIDQMARPPRGPFRA